MNHRKEYKKAFCACLSALGFSAALAQIPLTPRATEELLQFGELVEIELSQRELDGRIVDVFPRVLERGSLTDEHRRDLRSRLNAARARIALRARAVSEASRVSGNAVSTNRASTNPAGQPSR